ncbi:MAG: ABC transporter ATP-binding protein/permease [Parvibaculaceae bacterium]|nr:ABC transporter ATP-binding protein/permease [Parvibaculaceae bacterium]
MNLFQRIRENLTEAELKLVKRSIVLRTIDGFAMFAQTLILLGALNYIYNGGVEVAAFIGYSLAIILVFFARRTLLFASAQGLFSAAFDVGFKIRKSILTHLIKMPLGALSKLHLGKITQTLSEDISWIEGLISFVGPTGISNAFSALFLIVTVFFIDWRMGLLALASFVSVMAVLYVVRKRSKHTLRTRSLNLGDAALRTVEFVQGMPVLRSFGGYDKADNAYQKSIENLRKAFLDTNKRSANMTLLFFFSMDSAVAFSVLFSGYLVGNGLAHPTTVLAVLIVMLAASIPLRGAMGLALVSNLAQLAHDNISEIESHRPLLEVKDPHFSNGSEVVFEEVSFGYGDLGSVLNRVSFTAKANNMTAIVGPSGGGKTTTINLIARFWDVDEGAIYIGGSNIKSMRLEDVLAQISLVRQDVQLFNLSIYDNIAVGRINARKDEVIAAAKAAQAHEFIEALPDGYDTQVGVGGKKLSGGERQRISIACAILKDAPIILLDEATSAIDPENELAIQQAIAELTKDKTLIVIAHRLSTIVNADKIIVMNEGHVDAIARHDVLLAESGLYAQLWEYHINTSGWRMDH